MFHLFLSFGCRVCMHTFVLCFFFIIKSCLCVSVAVVVPTAAASAAAVVVGWLISVCTCTQNKFRHLTFVFDCLTFMLITCFSQITIVVERLGFGLVSLIKQVEEFIISL